jgi:hypothetical protein
MKAFKVKYGKGISLYHHFADDQNLISAVHKDYVQACVDGTYT